MLQKSLLVRNDYERNINHFRPDLGRREKINGNFYFHTSLWCPLKALIKPFEAPPKRVKIIIQLK